MLYTIILCQPGSDTNKTRPSSIPNIISIHWVKKVCEIYYFCFLQTDYGSRTGKFSKGLEDMNEEGPLHHTFLWRRKTEY